MEDESAEGPGPSQTPACERPSRQHHRKRHARQADCTGEPSENPGGDEKQQSREVGGKVEVVVGGQSDCIDRIVGQGEGGREGGREEGKEGLSRVLQALREALRQCRCACVRACVCVCMLFEGEGGGTGLALSLNPPEPIPGPSRRRPPSRYPGAAAPRGGWTRRDISEAERDSGQKTA